MCGLQGCQSLSPCLELPTFLIMIMKIIGKTFDLGFLSNKLKEIGINGKVCVWIHNFR